MRFAEHFSLCQTQGLLRVGHLGKRLGCALHSGDGFREGRGLATRGGYCSGGELRLATFARRSSGECARGGCVFRRMLGRRNENKFAGK